MTTPTTELASSHGKHRCSIKAVSEYLGHSDPGLTLRVYAHLMPSSQQRTRKAVDRFFLPAPSSPDSSETTQ
jgi:integrase